MAIIRTGAIYKSLQFGGVDSRDYGIYITGAAVYNAPERDVELVNVPGRNGAIILDNGHWNNIEITYPAGSFAPDQATFAANFAAFRNAIVSQVGYQRLTDGYNAGEYRIAAYLSGLEVDPAGIGQAGQFEIRFNCKPQRFLTSGETLATVAASGDTVTNPTLYESSPLIVAEGYGKIGFNGFEMEIFNTPIGTVTINGGGSESTQIYTTEAASWTYEYNLASFETGDDITVNGLALGLAVVPQIGVSYLGPISGSGYPGVTHRRPGGDKNGREWVFPAITFTVGTNGSASYTAVADALISKIDGSGNALSETINVTLTATHNAAAGAITFTVQDDFDIPAWNAANPDYPVAEQSALCSFTSITGNSTASAISEPIYIDTEIGEAYAIHDGEAVSLNGSVSIGSDLPVLAPGANAVTFDNTITALSIAGRWWQL